MDLATEPQQHPLDILAGSQKRRATAEEPDSETTIRATKKLRSDQSQFVGSPDRLNLGPKTTKSKGLVAGSVIECQPGPPLWIKSMTSLDNSVPLVTGYSPHSPFSIIAGSALSRLRIQSLPLPPTLSRRSGSLAPLNDCRDFAIIAVEAPWLGNVRLDARRIAVGGDEWLAGRGVEFLVGKKIIAELERLENADEQQNHQSPWKRENQRLREGGGPSTAISDMRTDQNSLSAIALPSTTNTNNQGIAMHPDKDFQYQSAAVFPHSLSDDGDLSMLVDGQPLESSDARQPLNVPYETTHHMQAWEFLRKSQISTINTRNITQNQPSEPHEKSLLRMARTILPTDFERDDPLDWIDQGVDSNASRSRGPKNGVSFNSESLSRLSPFSAQDSEDHASDLDNDDTRTNHLSSRSFKKGKPSDCADLNTNIEIKTKEVNEDGFSGPAPRVRIEPVEPELSIDLEDALLGLAEGSGPLMCLISEIRHSDPVTMIMSIHRETTWTDYVKLGLEELTKHRWNWWPFTPPKQPLKDNECQVEWQCSCGEKRSENVPFNFGQKLVEFVRQGSPSTKASNTHANTVVSTQSHNSSGKPSNFGSSNTPSLSSGGASISNTISVQNNISNTGSVQPQSADTREKHIFLVASCGSLQLHQIISTAQCTTSFSESLRKGYRQLRGFWRYWFSIYKFSHCDFFEFEKFCSSTFSDLGPGLPPEEYPHTEDYFYKPRPARSKTPISPKEFQHIYYHYRKTSAVRINTWYQPFTVMAQAPFYWPRFFRQPPPLLQQQIDGNLPTDTVPKIPQRLTHFDELSNNRETFWGLHAREQISAFMVSIYTLLALMPWLAFCFVYIFGLGNKEVDIQNATTPLTISLTTVSLFIAWLVKH